MKNDLNELNSVLFDTLRDLKNDKIDSKKAQAVSKVSGAIINSAKLQLSAAKFLKKGSIDTQFFGKIECRENRIPEVTEQTVYDAKLEYAISMGYDNIAAALNDIGKSAFENGFKAFKSSKND